MSSQLKYLMQLIEDENPEVMNTVLEELLSFGPSLELELARQSLRPNAKQREILHGIFEEHNRQWLRFTWPKLFDIYDETARLEQGWEWLAAFQNGRLYPFKVKYLLDQIAHEYLQTHQEKNEITLAQFLFGDEGLKANQHDYHSPLNSNLVHVIREKKGIPLSLASIYILIGERLGFHIEGYNFPGHFLAKINYNDRSVLVDCYNNGLLIDEKHLLFTSNLFSANLTEEDLKSSTNIILSRALRNLIRSYQNEPQNAAFILQLLKDFEELRKEVEDDNKETPTTDHAMFHIGQLVKHTKYGYRGVVVDYDLKCKADDNWYYSNQTQPPRNQPWYHVLVHTSTHNTYVAQNNLVADTSKQKIIHPLVYYFFSEFKDGEYFRNDNNWPNQY
ncbi:heat shock protein HspQ [Candidatus Uabimicrobium amorphum]|uniref:Heat shock protein HspQ n=1 Tax=Uabimicrobium amorphum TaxID=2596890 RepID=A0A5S9F2R4_UABAM|nr:heat shock protein HspQ [Candidatus Uabimicrobium amorphum]BBM82392.1 DNA-binding protein [Candidatus Uabimicrobium amorphum]